MDKLNIVISPSQQFYNTCAMGDAEANHTRLIAERLTRILIPDERLNVYLIPEINTGSDNANLIEAIRLSDEFINANGGEGRHLAIHTDGGGYARGASGLYVSEGGRNFILPILEEVMKFTPWDDVGLRRRTDLGELNQTIAIAGLIEISFHDNLEEAAWIHENIDNLAACMAIGLYRALGLDAPSITVDYKKELSNFMLELQTLIAKYEGVFK